MKRATMTTLGENLQMLNQVARALVELYDLDRDGDDYWHGVELADGSYADLNIWIDDDEHQPLLRVTAYAVTDDGIDTNTMLPLFNQRLKDHQTTNKENNR